MIMFVACDESGVESTAKYFVFGSVWLEKQDVIEFEKKIISLRMEKRCWGEVEWLKLSSSSTSDAVLDFYKNFISLAFEGVKIFFRFIIVEKNKLDMAIYHNNSEELVKLKFMHLSISRYAERFLDSAHKQGLHIIYDNFTESKKSRKEQWRIKTRDFIEKHLGCSIEHFQPCDSHISSLVQLCDLFTGAVGTAWNTSPSKISISKQVLMEHIESLTGKKLNAITIPTEKEFNIWVWKPVLAEKVF